MIGELRAQINELVKTGKRDLSLCCDNQREPREAQASLAQKLADSADAVMRMQAISILSEFPPKIVGESLRKMLKDSDQGNRTLAAAYLAKQANDPEARAVLFTNASSEDPTVAAAAIAANGTLESTDVAGFLGKILKNAKTDREVLSAPSLSS